MGNSETSPAARQPVFDQADLDWLKAELRDVRLQPAPKFDRPGSVRDAIRLFRLTPDVPPLQPANGPPIEPLAELDAYYQEYRHEMLYHGHQPQSELDFYAEHFLFTPWKWGMDFPLSQARDRLAQAWRRRVRRKEDSYHLSRPQAEAARATASSGSAVDPRQLQFPTAEPQRQRRELVGNELDDAALVSEIIQMTEAGMSQAEAINRVYLGAPRTNRMTSDKAVKDRLRGKVKEESTLRKQ